MEEPTLKNLSVFRYLNQNYIDEFFQYSRLRLSVFSEFSKHKDEQRLDTEEGWGVVVIQGKDKQLRSRAGIMPDAYILSTSLRGDVELMKAFGTNGYFKINDIPNFAIAVGISITGSKEEAQLGLCKYVGNKEIRKRMGHLVDEAVEKNKEGKLNLNKVTQLISMALIPEIFFLKSGRYAHQREFRFIWPVNYRVDEPLFIECPEALRFCEKVT